MNTRGGHRRWWWIVLLVAAGLFAGMQARPGSRRTDLPQSTAAGLLAPAQAGLSRAEGGVAGLWRDLGHVSRLQGEVDRLNRELESERRTQKDGDELASEVARLRALLGLKESVKSPAVAARVIARSPSPWFETLSLNVGSADQVAPGQAVLAPGGLLGQVYQVSRHTARVLCLTDRLGSVGARLAAGRARQVVGVARGDGAGGLSLTYGDADADARPGDPVVTSGFDQGSAFPPGLTVGHVLKVDRRRHDSAVLLTLRPAVEPDRVEEVLVLLGQPRGDSP
jgi:rod shape-determining protein MreC